MYRDPKPPRINRGRGWEWGLHRSFVIVSLLPGGRLHCHKTKKWPQKKLTDRTEATEKRISFSQIFSSI